MKRIFIGKFIYSDFFTIDSFCNSSVRFSSTFSTAKAKCLKPQLSGLEGLFGGLKKKIIQ